MPSTAAIHQENGTEFAEGLFCLLSKKALTGGTAGTLLRISWDFWLSAVESNGDPGGGNR
jgi:hypothetical protein